MGQTALIVKYIHRAPNRRLLSSVFLYHSVDAAQPSHMSLLMYCCYNTTTTTIPGKSCEEHFVVRLRCASSSSAACLHHSRDLSIHSLSLLCYLPSSHITYEYTDYNITREVPCARTELISLCVTCWLDIVHTSEHGIKLAVRVFSGCTVCVWS